eukprot:jgi/Mesvir1/10018/Mv03641-RA.1
MAALEAIDRSFNEWISAREAHDTGVWKKLRERIAAAEKQLQDREQELNRREAELDAREGRLKKHAETGAEGAAVTDDQADGDAQLDDANEAGEETEMANEEAEATPVVATTGKEAGKANAVPATELDRICRLGTAKDLTDHLGQKKKQDMTFIGKSLGSALLKADSPCRLVLDVLSGLTEDLFNEKPASKEMADRARRVCMAVLDGFVEAKVPFADLTDADEAKRIADDWYQRMDGQMASFDPVCANGFLALIATFAISSRYPSDFVENAAVHALGKRANFALLKALNLDDRMPAIIKKLVAAAKFPVVLRMVREFQLFSSVNIVPILQKFLANATNAPAQKGAELAAYKLCVRFLEENNLVDKMPLAPLQRKIEALEAMRINRQNYQNTAKRNAANKKLPIQVPPMMVSPPPAKFARYQEPYDAPFEPQFEPPRAMGQGPLARAPPSFAREPMERPIPMYTRVVEYESAPPPKLSAAPYNGGGSAGGGGMYRPAPAAAPYAGSQYPPASRGEPYPVAGYADGYEREAGRPVYRTYESYQQPAREEPAYYDGVGQRYRL